MNNIHFAQLYICLSSISHSLNLLSERVSNIFSVIPDKRPEYSRLPWRKALTEDEFQIVVNRLMTDPNFNKDPIEITFEMHENTFTDHLVAFGIERLHADLKAGKQVTKLQVVAAAQNTKDSSWKHLEGTKILRETFPLGQLLGQLVTAACGTGAMVEFAIHHNQTLSFISIGVALLLECVISSMVKDFDLTEMSIPSSYTRLEKAKNWKSKLVEEAKQQSTINPFV